MWFAPLLILIIIINYFIDSTNIFSRRKANEYVLADYLLNGYNFTGNPNFNDRLLQVDYINGLKDRKNVIVLGSSRSMLINKINLCSNSFFNNSVSGGTIEDYIGIFGMYEKRNLIPDTIVFCLDPWLLDNNPDFIGWNFISEQYYNEAKILEVKVNQINASTNENIRKYFQILSLTNFQTSINFLFKYGLDCYKPVITTCNTFFTKINDGSICYDSASRTKPPDAILSEIRSGFNESYIFGLTKYTSIDSVKLETITIFVKYLLSKNIKVILFLSPYHPEFYLNVLNQEKYNIVKEVEKSFRYLANQNHVKLIGSYDPYIYGFGEVDFYDWMHPKEQAIKKIFTDL